MNAELRCVIDAGVVVSAALFKDSVPRQALHFASTHGVVLVSQAVVEEMREVLERDKFDRYVSREKRRLFVEDLAALARMVEVTEQVQVCRDPKDDKYLALAVCGDATCIITGDQDLLVLNPFRGIPIVTPAQFLEHVSKHRRNGQLEPGPGFSPTEDVMTTTVTETIPLSTLAHGRSGDKGNHANVAVIAYTSAGFAWLRDNLTAEVVQAYFAPLQPTRVVRYEAANLLAFNFVLENVLAGGASKSLRVDSQGKTYALALLQMQVPRPANLEAMLRPARSTVS